MNNVLSPLLAMLFLALPVVARAQAPKVEAKAADRADHEVKQAVLYIKMGRANEARDLMCKTVETPSGADNGMAWLALGRAFFEDRNLDTAGQAVDRAKRLNVKARLGQSRWAGAFLAEFDEKVGALKVVGGACPGLAFSAKLAAPIADPVRKALLASAMGWGKGRLIRAQDKTFYLPVGRYQLGSSRVKVLAGELVRLNAEDLGAECAQLPQTLVRGCRQNLTVATGPADPGGKSSGGGSITSNTWFWVIVGASALAVAGGATAAGVLTSGGADTLSLGGARVVGQ